MTEKDKDLMERYIYEVVRRFQKEQRNEITMELQELIGDMAEEDSMENVLHKLGNPALFAQKYRDEKKYLISPEYFDDYEWVLKIVLGCVILSVVVSAIIQGILNGTWITKIIENIIGDGLVSLMGAFGVVTFIFAVLERQHIKVQLKKEEAWTVGELGKDMVFDRKVWTPKQLAPVPNKKALISRADCVIEIVFTVLLCGLFIFAPQLFGAHIFEENEFIRAIPIFNMNNWNIILPFLLVSLLMGFIDAMVRLVTGYYCKWVMISGVVFSTIQLILSYIVLKLLPFWNLSFMESMKMEFGWEATSSGDLLSYYGTDLFSNSILACIVLITAIEVGITIYRTVRYGTDRDKAFCHPKE